MADFLKNIELSTGGKLLPWVMGGAFLVITLLIILLIHRTSTRKRVFHMDPEELNGLEFEGYCAELLEANGFTDVEVTPATADFGVDIFAEKGGVSYAFQCKLYDHPVGTKAVQEIYAGRDFYHSMVGVVLTNQSFTSGAKKMAEALNILLWGTEEFREMEETASKGL